MCNCVVNDSLILYLCLLMRKLVVSTSDMCWQLSHVGVCGSDFENLVITCACVWMWCADKECAIPQLYRCI